MNVKKTKSSKKIVLKITMSMTESCQICDESNNVDHSLHGREWKHAAVEQGGRLLQKNSATATARPQEREPEDSPTP